MAVGALVATAAIIAIRAPEARTQTDTPPLDLTAPVEARNCTPCHPVIGAARTPGIIFTHAAHLMIECSACHFTNAHEDGRTSTPPMSACFSCHGLEHGPVGRLASGECRDCHTKDFDLRPRDHVKDWKGAPHARSSKSSGVNRCLMCHDAPADCDACHVAEGVEVGPMPTMYLPVVPVRQDLPSVLIDVDAGTSMGQCAFCHPRINGYASDRLIFTHDDHLKRAYRCTVCHERFPHRPDGTTDRNTMQACYRCHGLVHAANGQVAPEDCDACHPKDFELMPADHTVPFRVGKHRDRASKDASYCSMCHRSGFCVKCHNGGVKLADGRVSAKVIPADHRTVHWMPTHGERFLKQEGLCGVCHDSPSCQRCHQTSMPHPANWLAAHGKMNGSLPKDCKVCHQDRESCQECHHKGVRSTELIARNCVGCHPEMRTVPPTRIKNAGLAEHAVHFDVAKKKGKPYVCDDCHIGFGKAMRVQVTSPLSGPHDLRACYDCHGALDINNIIIAPYRGSELCRRCHTDLNI